MGPKKAPRKASTRKRKLCSELPSIPSSSSSYSSQQQNTAHKENALFWIFEKGGSLPVIVNEWLASYVNDQTAGLCVLMEMMFLVCGCKQTLPIEVFATESKPKVIAYMTKHILKSRDMYPIAQPGAAGRKFAGNLGEVLKEIVDQAQHSLLYDGSLMPTFVDYLTCLSTSQVRAFRHTSTLAALKLRTHLVEVQAKMLDKHYSFKRLLDNSKRTPHAVSHAETCSSNISEVEENIRELEGLIKSLFHGCFVTRFRDVVFDIRELTVRELAKWIVQLPDQCMSYFKYVKQALVDPTHQVRFAALQCLQEVLQDDSIQDELEGFLKKIKEILLDRVRDKHIPCAVVATDVFRTIVLNQNLVLQSEDRMAICGFVYSSHRLVAHSAGGFLVTIADHPNVSDSPASSTNTASTTASSENTLAWLIRYHISNLDHVSDLQIPALVDAVFNHSSIFTNWKVMAKMLLCEQMNSNEEDVMIQIMVACVSCAVKGSPYVLKAPTVKEAKARQKNRDMVTELFIPVLPSLLSKYTDPKLLTCLLSIIDHMDLELYQQARDQKFQNLLLDELYRIVSLTYNQELMKSCTASLFSLHQLGDQYSIATVSRLKERMIAKLKQGYAEQKATPKHADIGKDTCSRLEWSLQVAAVLSQAFNVFEDEVYKIIHAILMLCLDDVPVLPDKAYENAIIACYRSLLWSGICQGMSVTPTHERFFALLLVVMKVSPSSSIKHTVFATGCDFIVAFKVATFSEIDKVTEFVVLLGNFLVTHILNGKPYPGTLDEQQDHRVKMVQYWKLILMQIAAPKMAYPFFYNYQKLSGEYRLFIEEMLVHTWDEGRHALCASVLIQGLKENYLLQQKTLKSVKEANAKFVEVSKTAATCSQWLSKLDKHTEASAALAKNIGEEIDKCITDHLLPVLEVIANFVTHLTIADKKKLHAQLMKIHNMQKPKPVQILLQALGAPVTPKDKTTKPQEKTSRTTKEKSNSTAGPSTSKVGRLNRLDVKVIHQPAPHIVVTSSLSATEAVISDDKSSSDEERRAPIPQRQRALLVPSTLRDTLNKFQSSRSMLQVSNTDSNSNCDFDPPSINTYLQPRGAPLASSTLNERPAPVSEVSYDGNASEDEQPVKTSQQKKSFMAGLPITSTPTSSNNQVTKSMKLGKCKKLPSQSSIASDIDIEMACDTDYACSESSDNGQIINSINKGFVAVALSAISPEGLGEHVRGNEDLLDSPQQAKKARLTRASVTRATEADGISSSQIAVQDDTKSSGHSSDCISDSQLAENTAKQVTRSKQVAKGLQESKKQKVLPVASVLEACVRSSPSSSQLLEDDYEATVGTEMEAVEIETGVPSQSESFASDVSSNADGSTNDNHDSKLKVHQRDNIQMQESTPGMAILANCSSPDKSFDTDEQSLESDVATLDQSSSGEENEETIDDIKVEVTCSPKGSVSCSWRSRPNLSLKNVEEFRQQRIRLGMLEQRNSTSGLTVNRNTFTSSYKSPNTKSNETSDTGSSEFLAEPLQSNSDNLALETISEEDDPEMNPEPHRTKRCKPLPSSDTSSFSAGAVDTFNDAIRSHKSYKRTQSPEVKNLSESVGSSLKTDAVANLGQSSEYSNAADGHKRASGTVSLLNQAHNLPSSSVAQSSENSIILALSNRPLSNLAQNSDSSSEHGSLERMFCNSLPASLAQTSDHSDAAYSPGSIFQNLSPLAQSSECSNVTNTMRAMANVSSPSGESDSTKFTILTSPSSFESLVSGNSNTRTGVRSKDKQQVETQLSSEDDDMDSALLEDSDEG